MVNAVTDLNSHTSSCLQLSYEIIIITQDVANQRCEIDILKLLIAIYLLLANQELVSSLIYKFEKRCESSH